jgi:NADPH-dependent 2,4-dienoyl-CoA reductase/sulfur reductase-like enzyme
VSRVVIIGGDAAGMSAAAQASRSGADIELVVFERSEHTSYAACGLPYFVAGLITDSDKLVARSPEQHRANGIDVRTGHEVVSIDTVQRHVVVRNLATGTETTEPFDQLVIATGASAVRPPFTNIDARGVMNIKVIPDAVAIEEILRDRSPRRAVVVGAGYIGLEMAEAFMLRGLEVTILERLDQPMATLDADMAAELADGIRGLGIDLRLGVSVTGFEVDADGWVTAVTTDAGVVPTDLVVMGLGVRANSQLASDAGIAVGPSGAIATDEQMLTSVPGIYAAGDCAESFHRISKRPVSIALGTHANKQGRVVGINISGGDLRFPGVIGTAVTKIGHIEIGRTGLTMVEAADAGLDAVASKITAGSRAHYYPDGAPMTVKIVSERNTGRMLGAQIVGGPEAAKRIDTLAIAIWNEMTVDDFSQTDLGYAPPFSPVWDPILTAARTKAR